jgi:cytochrome c nitrite reductase small subunit
MPSKWTLTIGTAVLLFALGVFGWVTNAPSYLGHDPSACNTCHVMDAEYEGWFHVVHERFAVCTDCHLPHQNLASYYLYKGYSGMRDVYSFTFKTYPAAIRATHQTDEIVQANCIRCHTEAVGSILSGEQPFDRYCWDCHRSVAHGDRGLSLTPYQDLEVYTK